MIRNLMVFLTLNEKAENQKHKTNYEVRNTKAKFNNFQKILSYKNKKALSPFYHKKYFFIDNEGKTLLKIRYPLKF